MAACPRCGYDPEAIQVWPEDVADSYEIWLADPQQGQGKLPALITEPVKIITVKGALPHVAAARAHHRTASDRSGRAPGEPAKVKET